MRIPADTVNEGAGEAPRRAPEGLADVCLVFAALVLGVCAVLLLRTFHGDPTIYLVYARNIAAGDFFSFNPGEFSSGATSPLWALILAIPFLLPGSVLLAKLLAAGACFAAWALCFHAARRVGGSRLGAAVASGVAVWALVFPGLLLYEAPLLVGLLAALILLNVALVRSEAAPPVRVIAGLALCWACAPLTRPDAVLVIALDVIVLGVHFVRRRWPLAPLIAGVVLSALPSAVYFGCSQLTSGVLSASSRCRTFALLEQAPRIWGVRYGLVALDRFAAIPLLPAALLGAWGWGRLRGDPRLRPLADLSAAVPLAYLALLTIIVPAPASAERYLLPAIPFLVVLAAIGFDALWSVARERRGMAAVALAAFVLLPAPGLVRTWQAVAERKKGYDFDTITESGCARFLNEAAPRGATILLYEVQARFQLRGDLKVLSLDGVTDGKIAPELANGRVEDFLWRTRPDFWVANDAVRYRPYLARSILREVVDRIGGQEGAACTIAGVTFKNLRVRAEPPPRDFAGGRQIFSLTYSGPRGE